MQRFSNPFKQLLQKCITETVYSVIRRQLDAGLNVRKTDVDMY